MISYKSYFFIKENYQPQKKLLMHSNTRMLLELLDHFLHMVAQKPPSLLAHHSFIPTIVINFVDIYDGTNGK